MILLEPVGLDSRNVAQSWPLIPRRGLLNMQTLRQRSHTLGWKCGVCQSFNIGPSRGQYLALSKAWHSCC